MTLVYVLRYYPTLSETFIIREIDAMLAAGVLVEIVAIGHRADGALARDLPPVRVWRPPRRGRVRWLASRLRHVHRLHAHFDGEASALALELSGTLQIPYSITLHAVDLFKPNSGIVHRLHMAEAVFTVCEHHRTWIGDRYRVNAHLARCGVSIPLGQADPSKQPAQVITVARDAPKKDLPRLRRALSSTQRPVSGHKILSNSFQTVVQQELLRSQLFALPCRVAPDGDRDGVPVSMMEAMAAGLPVVTRPVAGIPELVDETVGWIDLDFENALDRALKDPTERRIRGERARQRIRASWGIGSGAASMRDVWDKIQP